MAQSTEEGGAARLGAYLRHLREGYGFTLRRVEEQAMELGEAIDNSQLSRFEKGKAIPSFGKLRALATIFNVPVQAFSDVLDLEKYEAFKPDSVDYDALIKSGASLMEAGKSGQAFVTFERAVEVAQSAERIDYARMRTISSIKDLGKLSLAERELRESLQKCSGMAPSTQRRMLFLLCSLLRERGEYLLASALGRQVLDSAAADGDLPVQVGVYNLLGNICSHQGDYDRGVEYYSRAIELAKVAREPEQLQLAFRANRAQTLVWADRLDEAIEYGQATLARAREVGALRIVARSLTTLGEAYLRKGERERGLAFFAESDALASPSDESFHDVLFLNSFFRWKIAREDNNPTREKIAFGRLRRMRAMLELRFAQVEEFDRFVEERGKNHARS